MAGSAILYLSRRPGFLVVEVCTDDDVARCLAAVAWVRQIQVEAVVDRETGRRLLAIILIRF